MYDAWVYMNYGCMHSPFHVFSDDQDAVAPDASTTPVETSVRKIQSLLEFVKQAYEAQSAAMRDLQAQLITISQSQDAIMNRLALQEESAKGQESATPAESYKNNSTDHVPEADWVQQQQDSQLGPRDVLRT